VRNRHHAGCRVAVERAADRYTLICDRPLSVAEKAAVIDGGGDPSEYQVAFDKLRKDCADHPSEERIADMLVLLATSSPRPASRNPC
jgi:hypothetical protein